MGLPDLLPNMDFPRPDPSQSDVDLAFEAKRAAMVDTSSSVGHGMKRSNATCMGTYCHINHLCYV